MIERIDRGVIRVVALVIVGLSLTACQRGSEAHDDESPAKIVHANGSQLSRVILSANAIERIGLKTDQVREQRVSRSASPRKVVPYAALIYDLHGETWIYTNPEPRIFVRHRISVDYIDGDLAVLLEGPPPGTAVVTVGVAQLFGTELGVGN